MEKKGKILIVDDNEDVLLSLNMLLKPYVEGIRVINTPERIIGIYENCPIADYLMLSGDLRLYLFINQSDDLSLHRSIG